MINAAIIALLILLVPGIIAARLHGVTKVTRENWQAALFAYLVYTLLILFVNLAVAYAGDALAARSFSPQSWLHMSFDSLAFSFRYTLVALACAAALPYAWRRRGDARAWSVGKWEERREGKQKERVLK